MNKSIIISAERLKKNNPKKKYIVDFTNDILYKINSQIDTAFKNNHTEIIINLPISFNIPSHFNHKEFQLEVYYQVISILECKNYEINIRILKNETLLKINWSYSNGNMEDMKKKIRSLMF
jgi:hypothetical protein